MNTTLTSTSTNNICIDAWQVGRRYLLHSINQRINYRYFHYLITQLPAGVDLRLCLHYLFVDAIALVLNR